MKQYLFYKFLTETLGMSPTLYWVLNGVIVVVGIICCALYIYFLCKKNKNS